MSWWAWVDERETLLRIKLKSKKSKPEDGDTLDEMDFEQDYKESVDHRVMEANRELERSD